MKGIETAWMSMCDWCGDGEHEPRGSRRNFPKTSALLALAPWNMGIAVAADPSASSAPPPPNTIAPAEAMRRLMNGNARSAANQMNERDFFTGRAARVRGNIGSPAILSSADSHVARELAFD